MIKQCTRYLRQHAVPSRLPTIRHLAVIGLILALVAGAFGCAVETPEAEAIPNSPLNEQVIGIPVEDPPAVTLQVTILHPNGDGPFPLAIMNHGATGISTSNRGKRYRLTNAAFYFLSRGYAVALPMIRGFAASGGEYYHFGCDFASLGTANARDIRAVIRALSDDPLLDSRRVIVAGQSFGGWNTLALGGLNIPNVKGLINFNGGIGASDCLAGDSSLVAAAKDFGARTTIPSIWFYGENDDLLPVDIWRALYDGYTRSGAPAELVNVGVVMKNSHAFLAYPEALPLWTPKVDSFLARIGMPSAMVNSGYLPLPFPPATQFAGLTDVAAIPYLSKNDRDLYRRFLEAPFPRAFVISETGSAAVMNSGFDPLSRALALCQKGTARCGVYAVDDRVVWTPFPAVPQEPPNHHLPEASHADTTSKSPGTKTATPPRKQRPPVSIGETRQAVCPVP